jgi:hypothetical protein
MRPATDRLQQWFRKPFLCGIAYKMFTDVGSKTLVTFSTLNLPSARWLVGVQIRKCYV